MIRTSGLHLKFSHAVSWIPEFIINNDNSGPYLSFPAKLNAGTNYAMENMIAAMPLLPTDVFMSGEEALTVGLETVANLYQGFQTKYSADALIASGESVALRILLVEKRKLRSWAATTEMDQDLKDTIRLMDLPKRVWVLELHLKKDYGNHGGAHSQTLVGFVLIDPTGDIVSNSVLMFYINDHFPLDPNVDIGSFVLFENGLPVNATKTTDKAPLLPIRN